MFRLTAATIVGLAICLGSAAGAAGWTGVEVPGTTATSRARRWLRVAMGRR